jgi:hypothetical protein
MAMRKSKKMETHEKQVIEQGHASPNIDELWQVVQRQATEIEQLRAQMRQEQRRDRRQSEPTAPEGGRRMSRAGLMKVAGIGVAALAGAEIAGSFTADHAAANTIDDFFQAYPNSAGTLATPAFSNLPYYDGSYHYNYPVGVGVFGNSYGVDAKAVDGQNNLNGGIGVRGRSGSGNGVHGVSISGTGVEGDSTDGYGVNGSSTTNIGVAGTSDSNYGVSGVSNSWTAVNGASTSGYGVNGSSSSSIGVAGTSGSADGVYGENTGTNNNVNGVHGVISNPSSGVGTAGVKGEILGAGPFGAGIYGSHAGSGYGVHGVGQGGSGVFGESTDGRGVAGVSTNGLGGSFGGGLAPILLYPGTTAGYPTTGSHSVGEIYVDANGVFWVCIAGNGITAGTWKSLSSVVPIPNVRVMNTRPGGLNIGPYVGPIANNQTLTLPLAGHTFTRADSSQVTIPATATGVIGNLTAADATAGCFLTLVPHGASTTHVSSVNFPALAQGSGVANSFTVGLSSDGKVDIYTGNCSSYSANIIIDITGYIV